MNATTKLLDQYKAVRSIESDNAAANALGIARATVSGWRRQGKQAEPHVVAAMAKATQEDPAKWLAAIESERAKPADKKVWQSIAMKLGYAAAITAVAFNVTQVVAGDGIEPPTRGFSIPCSTN